MSPQINYFSIVRAGSYDLWSRWIGSYESHFRHFSILLYQGYVRLKDFKMPHSRAGMGQYSLGWEFQSLKLVQGRGLIFWLKYDRRDRLAGPWI